MDNMLVPNVSIIRRFHCIPFLLGNQAKGWIVGRYIKKIDLHSVYFYLNAQCVVKLHKIESHTHKARVLQKSQGIYSSIYTHSFIRRTAPGGRSIPSTSLLSNLIFHLFSCLL